ncbi:alpha/beta fold hydrolase [Microbacterium foliorum]|uniref:alpha/beta fold hydrolase n=1 Tax=Microbacterium foliorum TaxID=104336 RepID=UPI001E510DA1|nr:alpha/beta hydrolase [Microbacterium foliorum]
MNLKLRLDGCTVAYSDSGGTGRPVLFLHGAGVDHAMFEQQVGAVSSSGRRSVTWDMRAHGLSRPNTSPITANQLVSDAESVIAALGLSRPVLVGHSLGGNIAQELIRRNPAGFSAMAVMDATWNAGPLSSVERLLLRLAAPMLALVPERFLPEVMAKASAVTPSGRSDLARAFAQVPKREFLAIWRSTVSLVSPAPDYRTPVPLLLVVGDRDRTGNIAKAMPAWARHEGTREVVIPEAGHVPSQDSPAAVTEALLRFLDSLDQDR